MKRIIFFQNGYNQGNNTQANDSKPIIEIPQEYYDKLKQEEEEKKKNEEERLKQEEIIKQNNQNGASIWGLMFLNLLIISGSVYYLLDKNEYTLVGLASYILVGSLSNE